MKANVGNIDKIIRIVIGLVIIIWGIAAGSWWGLIGLIPLITGVINWCPLYKLLGISSRKAKKEEA